VIDSGRIEEIFAVASQLQKWLGLVDDFRTFRIKQPGPEFFAFLAFPSINSPSLKNLS
jgi:hypothetical protein